MKEAVGYTNDLKKSIDNDGKFGIPLVKTNKTFETKDNLNNGLYFLLKFFKKL